MSFSTSATRQLTAGDTMDLDDELKSYPMFNQNIGRGDPTYIDAADGFVKLATTPANVKNNARFVPVESKDNSGGSAGDLEIKGVLAPQIIALKTNNAMKAGAFAQAHTVKGEVINATGSTIGLFARLIGGEGALFNRAGTSPFAETLSAGVVPEQNLAAGGIGFFQLIENGIRLA